MIILMLLRNYKRRCNLYLKEFGESQWRWQWWRLSSCLILSIINHCSDLNYQIQYLSIFSNTPTSIFPHRFINRIQI